MDRITSLRNQRIKALAKLPNKGGLFLVEGFHLVEMALEEGCAEEIFSLEPYETAAPVTLVSREIIAKLAATKSPEGIVALCHRPQNDPFDTGRALVLDGVQDPGNVGTLLRTALSFGFRDAYLSNGSADPMNRKAVLASQGAIFRLHIVPHDDLIARIGTLKSEGYAIVSTDLKASSSLSSLPKKGKIALVLGSEGQGVSSPIQALADARVRLEMSGIDSLNVAVAGGILMYELRK
ncbi:MAG: RNA methyltransferase [Bacilli bacterium]|jgi:TrmH family RNA methyltransferase|nr:RNA methyltransferase [Bacilli bacterium]